ncbi:MAG: NAD-dependent epimerase/dehydratase family protein, partial [Actinomycetes bacterium]
MTVVVTGAAGFLGGALVRALLEDGERVVAVDRHPLVPRPGLTVLTADLVDRDPRVLDALAGAEAAYHLAGCPGVRDQRPGVDAYRHRDNVLATAAVLQ